MTIRGSQEEQMTTLVLNEDMLVICSNSKAGFMDRSVWIIQSSWLIK